MTLSLSDTLATVKDTVARVKIMEQDSVICDAETDSSVTISALLKKDSPLDIYDSVWAECQNDSSINMMSVLSADTVCKESVLHSSQGVYGVYNEGNVTRNDVISSLVIMCFFVTMTIFSVARNYISTQTKKFFGKVSKSRSFTAETINEVKLNIYFTLQSCLIFSIISYIFADTVVDTSNIDFTLTLLVPIGTVFFLIYFILKYLLYMGADIIFYDDKKIRRQHTDDICYITTAQGLLLLPSLLLAISTGIEPSNLAIYVVTVIVFAKLLAFYKTISTFSGHYKTFLQIILYFCALEMIPLMSLCGILAMTVKYL